MKYQMKKSVCWVLTLVMVFSLFCTALISPDAAALKDDCGYEANGRVSDLWESEAEAAEGEVYKIMTKDDFAAFISYVNSGKPTKGVTFYITKDITLNNLNDYVQEWAPVGNSAATPFEGTFDGCGFMLKKLQYSGSGDNIAAFGYVSGKDAVIKNLGVNGSISGGKTLAGLVAHLDGASIINCWNACDVSGSTNVGGIAGEVRGGKIINCADYAYISGTSNVGGIAGSISLGSLIEYSYYVYYCADKACGKVSADSSATTYRFATSSTESLVEKTLTVGSETTDDLTSLLNAWVEAQENKKDYCGWVFDTSEKSIERTNGKFPSQRYSGYIDPADSIYEATSSVSNLYESGMNASEGCCYSISSAEELYTFAQYVNSGLSTKGATFFLTADIVVGTGADSVDKINWTPVGQKKDFAFQGVFDGQGYIISGLLMTQPDDDLGLFGYVNNIDAVIKNVGVTGIINGHDHLGGIVGNLLSGSVINSWYDGSVTGDNRIGGIVGTCKQGNIYNCCNFSSVTGNSRVGGIVGGSEISTTLKHCYYNAETPSGYGEDDGTMSVVISFTESKTDCDYSLERSINVGSYATMKLLNALNYWVESKSTDNSYRYWKIDDSAESVVRVQGTHPVHLYPGDNSGVKYVDEPYEDLEPSGNPYSVIYAETATMTELYESGVDGLPGGHYSINSGEELKMLATYVNVGHETSKITFYLTDDISIAYQATGQNGDGWTPIGKDANITDSSTYFRYFKGTFDGCGYMVYNLFISKNEEDEAGLFGNTLHATIKNLGVVGDIVAENKVGGIVGEAEETTITNCWTAVNIQAEDRTGGIAGAINDTDITNCVSYCQMVVYGGSATAKAGGIVGDTDGTCNIDCCYYLKGTVTDPYEKISGHTTANIIDFSYEFINDEYVCKLSKAAVVDDVSTSSLLTALNAWVYADNSGLYSAWYNSNSLISVGGVSGHYPKLMNPTITDTGENEDYKGDYTSTATMSQLYSYRTDGIEGCCYSINSLADLEALQKYVSDGYKTSGIIFFMTRDIDMSATYSADTGRSWPGIGEAGEPFKGIFDGQGYTIKYIYINATDEDRGLFNHASGEKMIIKNLGIGGGIVMSESNSGGIVGDFDFGVIKNCWVSCQVTSVDGNAGGIVGGANMGSIINCTNYGIVAQGKAFGAIAGYAIGTNMQYCYYLYATCQKAYSEGSVVNEKGVYHFNGTSGLCILDDNVEINGQTTKNALSALKLYVDSQTSDNLCYWTSGNTAEYALMGVTMFPVLISASGTMGEKDFNTIVAYVNGTPYYSLASAVTAANDTPGGATVELADDVILRVNSRITLDDDVSIDTGDHTMLLKDNVCVTKVSQLQGTYIIKDGGSIDVYNPDTNSYSKYFYANKGCDASCGSVFYSQQSLTIQSNPVSANTPDAYNLVFHDGEFIVNSTLESGNPHRIPAASTIKLEKMAKLRIPADTRIRTTGGAAIYLTPDSQKNISIGNVTLDCKGASKLVGVFEDDLGTVTLPFAYKDGYNLRYWSDGKWGKYDAGATAYADSSITLSAVWRVGDPNPDPYPGDDYYNDGDGPNYNIPITIIQSGGGKITPDSIVAAKGENLDFKVNADTGYYIKTVLLDKQKTELDKDNYYHFVSINQEHELITLFAPLTNYEYYNYSNKFTDVNQSSWCYNNVRFVTTMGIFSGLSDTVFGVDQPTTRAQFITFLWRMSGKPVVPGDGCSFADVRPDSYYYEAVRWGVHFGIVSGYSDTQFGSNDSISRQALVTMLFRYAKNYACDDVAAYDSTNILTYNDVMDISKGMTQSFQWAIGAGIVSGTTDNCLNPKGTASRAHVAAFISRYCNQFMLETPVPLSTYA